MFKKRRTADEYAQTFSTLTDDVWTLCQRIRKNFASDLEFQKLLGCSKKLKKTLNEYKQTPNAYVPEDTVWLAEQMLDAATDISTGYSKLRRLSAS